MYWKIRSFSDEVLTKQNKIYVYDGKGKTRQFGATKSKTQKKVESKFLTVAIKNLKKENLTKHCSDYWKGDQK